MRACVLGYHSISPQHEAVQPQRTGSINQQPPLTPQPHTPTPPTGEPHFSSLGACARIFASGRSFPSNPIDQRGAALLWLWLLHPLGASASIVSVKTR